MQNPPNPSGQGHAHGVLLWALRPANLWSDSGLSFCFAFLGKPFIGGTVGSTDLWVPSTEVSACPAGWEAGPTLETGLGWGLQPGWLPWEVLAWLLALGGY